VAVWVWMAVALIVCHAVTMSVSVTVLVVRVTMMSVYDSVVVIVSTMESTVLRTGQKGGNRGCLDSRRHARLTSPERRKL
jgi:hypothetical protein